MERDGEKDESEWSWWSVRPQGEIRRSEEAGETKGKGKESRKSNESEVRDTEVTGDTRRVQR